MNGRPWPNEDREFVRHNYGTIPTQDIADAVERTIDQVRDMARKLRVTRKIERSRRWTDDELEILRRDYNRLPAAELAAALGRTTRGIYVAARIHGLSATIRPWAPAETRTLKKMNAGGCPDSHIARQLGRDRHAVSARRKALGLPSHEKGEKWRQAISAGVKRQCERLGLSSPTELRTEAFKRFARESGWPQDLRPREVQILNVLAARGVPMTLLELAEAIGMRTDRTDKYHGQSPILLTGNGPGGTYTASLMRRGLILKLKRACPGTPGKGFYFRCRDLYFLGPAALTILEERACKETAASI